jgi:hypothetical protein
MKQKVSEEEELSAGPEDVMFSDDLAGINGATLAHIIADENLKNQSAAVLADAPLQVVANETNQPKVNTESPFVLHRII